MAPKRSGMRRRRRRRGGIKLYDESTFISQISPNSSVTISWSLLPSPVQHATFKLKSFRVTASSLDVATANAFSDGPAFFQMRQLDTDGKTTLRTSPPFVVGPQPKSFHLRCDPKEYVGPWRGDHLVAVDCLCPKTGYERGLGLSISLRYVHDHIPISEACPTVTAVPTASIPH